MDLNNVKFGERELCLWILPCVFLLGVTSRKALLDTGVSDNNWRRPNRDAGFPRSSTLEEDALLVRTVKSNGIATDIIKTHSRRGLKNKFCHFHFSENFEPTYATPKSRTWICLSLRHKQKLKSKGGKRDPSFKSGAVRLILVPHPDDYSCRSFSKALAQAPPSALPPPLVLPRLSLFLIIVSFRDQNFLLFLFFFFIVLWLSFNY